VNKKLYGIAHTRRGGLQLIFDSIRPLKRQALSFGRDLLPKEKRRRFLEFPLQTLRANGYELVVLNVEVKAWENKHWTRRVSNGGATGHHINSD